MKISLIASVKGALVGAKFDSEATVTVGREIGNSLASVSADGLSRHHARFCFRAGKWMLEDLGSTNGTFRNGVRIAEPVEVTAGDRLQFGKFEVAVDEIATETATASAPSMVPAAAKSATAPVAAVKSATAPVAAVAPAAAPAQAARPVAPAAAAAAARPTVPIKPMIRPAAAAPTGGPVRLAPKPGAPVRLMPKPAGAKPVAKAMALVAAALTAGAAFAARPLARWDVIPYQRISGVFKAGVVAFHEKGCKVEFSVNGKKVFTAEEPTLNPRTKVKEYVFDFNAKQYPDGLVNLRATVVAPGEPRYELPEMPLYANVKKTQGARKAAWVDLKNGNDFSTGTKDEPVKSIKMAVQKAGDGGTVFLMPGEYQMKLIGGGKDRKFWTLIQPAPGVEREQVRFMNGRPGTDKLHFKNVEICADVTEGYGTLVMGEGGESMAWFDNCKMYNKGGRHGGAITPFGNKLRAFVTGGETTEVANGPNGEIVRQHKITSIADCALPTSDTLVVNTEISDIDAGPTEVDADVFNGFASGKDWAHDVIVYGVKATGCKSKAFSAKRLRDSAFVDVEVETDTGDLVCSRFSDEMKNCLFERVTLLTQEWQLARDRGIAFVPEDVLFRDCRLKSLSGYTTSDGSMGFKVEGCEIGAGAGEGE